MSRRRRHPEKPVGTNKIVRVTKQRLALIIGILIVVSAILFLYHSPVAAIVLFIVIFLTLMSPIIIEFTKTPRTYPDPGRHPYDPWKP